MPTLQLLLNPMRTAKQGVQVNIGKDSDEYIKITTTLSVLGYGITGRCRW